MTRQRMDAEHWLATLQGAAEACKGARLARDAEWWRHCAIKLALAKHEAQAAMLALTRTGEPLPRQSRVESIFQAAADAEARLARAAGGRPEFTLD